MAIPSRQIGGSTTTALLWEISKQLEKLICIRSGGCGQITTTTTTSTTYIPSTLGCVYYTNYGEFPYTLYAYDVTTNTSTPVVIPTGDEIVNFAETHTVNRYWKGNQNNLIREWVPTSNPNILQVNRNISVSGIVGSNGNYFTFLEAVDDNHLLTTVFNPSSIDNTLTLLDITSGAVTASEITYLFDIYAPAGLDSFILTSTNKIIAIGRRDVGQFDTNVYFLTQYSYPNGVLEVEINLSSMFTYTGERGPQLFENADGKLYIFADSNISGNQFSTIFEINLSTYEITPVWSDLGLYNASINSTVECNTVNLIPAECLVYLAANNNIYAYDPLTNISVEILTIGDTNIFGVANTNTKLWVSEATNTIDEYDLALTPGPVLTFNRTINIGGTNQYGSFAIDNVTLIIGTFDVYPQASVYELDITTSTATRTFKGDVTNGYTILDLMLTTDGKLIVLGVANNTPTASVIWQYDYATWTLETTLDLFNQFTNGEDYAVGLAEYSGDIYLFARISNCIYSDPSGVYLVDTLTNTITYTGQETGFGCPTGASSWLPCNTTSLNPCIPCEVGDITIGTQVWAGCNLDVDHYQIGTPTLSICGTSCGTTLIDNVLEVTFAYPSGGASLVQVDSTNSYTQITITGPGGGLGSTFSLCLDPVVPPLDCTSCNIIALPNATVGGVGTVTYGDLIINTTYSGPTLFNSIDSINTCVGLTTPSNCLGIGNIVGDFIYTLNFSEPVNNIKFLLGGGGVADGSSASESYTFTTNDGDPIPEVTDPVEWFNLTTGAWCHYDNDPNNSCTYGRLYNWYALNDPRGIAPPGYHVPTDSEFITLMNYLDPAGTPDNNIAGGPLKETGFVHWISPNTDATNLSGFTGLPGGALDDPTPGVMIFTGKKAWGVFWTSASAGTSPDTMRYWELWWNQALFEQKQYYKHAGYSARLIKDQECCSVPNITIGTQTWTGCNLNVDTYQNGDPIPQVQDPVAWAALTTGAWCYYNNDSANGCEYGKLYNYHAIEDPRGLIPAGYHLPTPTEIVDLYTYLGGASVAGGELKETGTTHWLTPNTGATNSSGWTGLPGGLRFGGNYLPDPGGFVQLRNYGLFWTDATIISNERVYSLYSQSTDLYVGGDDPTTGHSIRLIENNLCSVGDVIIGTQTWTGCNLNVSYYRNGDVIPQVSDPTAWAGLNTGAWCWYNNDASNGATYGKLYNWYAVNDPRGLAPEGYHIPTVAEYNILQTELGGLTSGGPLKEAGFAHWIAPNTGATNTSGWTGLPGGQRSFNSVYEYIGQGAAFWTSSSVDPLNATALQLYFTNDNFIEFPSLQTVGFSIRLVKDLPPTTTTTTTIPPSGFNTIYTHFEALTLTTTTTLAPSGFNTIYTHFESL